MKALKFLLLIVLCLPVIGATQADSGIDPEALIERILAVELQQKNRLHDVTFDAEYIEGENKDGEFVEKLRVVKKVFIKYLPDTVLYREEYKELYKDRERKSDKDMASEYKDRIEKKEKRKGRDVSYPILKPFYPENRDLYQVNYEGVTDERIDGYVCHHFRVDARDEVDTLINGDYYFEAGAFHLVRVDFSPAKLVKKTMFKLKSLNMTIIYGPTADDIWLPRQFEVSGEGKAALFFGVNFTGTEYYRNPRVNKGLSESDFEKEQDDD